MDLTAHSPAPNGRTTGIPRVSKLPMVQPKSSQLPVTRREAEAQPTIKAPSKPPSKPSSKPSTLQNRRSIAVFPNSKEPSAGKISTSTSTLPKVSTLSTRNAGGDNTRKASAGSRLSYIRPSSRSSSVRSFTSNARCSSAFEDGEHHDQLSSLESFRSASRQGWRDEYLLADSVEHVLNDEAKTPPAAVKTWKVSRPSLSDRTIESLQSVPSTPKDRRQSNFFSPVESPMGSMRPPSRPASRVSHNGSNPGSRPGTSDGLFIRPPSPVKRASTGLKPPSKIATGGFGFTPGSIKGRSVSGALPRKPESKQELVPPSPRTPVSSRQSGLPGVQSAVRVPRTLTGSKTVAAKPTKQRPPLSNAFDPWPQTDDSRSQEPSTPVTATKICDRKISNPANPALSNLRQQIAAAKAAARQEKTRHDSAQDGLSAMGNEFDDLHLDPFNQVTKDEKHILRNRIKAARMDGKLNIAALGLEQIPDEVLNMYDSAAMEESNVNWAEVVDLTRLIAADNKLSELGDSMFPDKTMQEFEAEELNHQFGGLETLDVHGNVLASIPMGLRRLERLTSLNLAYNKLDVSVLDIVCQIKSLKHLKLGHNALAGNLPASLCQLEHLESLDLQSNRILGLPEAVRELVSLKVLNVASNQLTTLPMEAFQELNLTELDASSNALIGALFPLGGTNGHPTIQTLSVANNSIAALAFSDTLDFPRLRELDVTNNHLTVLPNISGWGELITLAAGENKMTELPAGFSRLRKLKNANFTSNELRLLDPAISKMESLEYLILASNPLREKKFLTMSAHDIKKDLKARLEPAETEAPVDDINSVDDSISPSASSPTPSWMLKANGVLDLSNKSLSDSVNDSLGSFLTRHDVKELHLRMNKLTAVPPALWLGQEIRILDLSGNALGRDYLSDELALPALQELRLKRCSLTTLDPLLTQLRVPNLHTLDITANRLSGPLPMLRASYPALRTLHAADNGFTAVSAEALRGLYAVTLASNSIDRLPPEIGLLWDEGLRSLAIGSNTFRVPNYRILDKGTEATLRWLRDRLPASVIAEAGSP